MRLVGADHVAGAGFIAFGLLVFAISGDLPFGSLSLTAMSQRQRTNFTRPPPAARTGVPTGAA